MTGLLGWQIFFAGLWGQVWNLSWPVLAIAACVAFATLAPAIPVIGVFIPRVARQAAIVIAVIIFAFLLGEVNGINVADAKCKARGDVVKKKVDDVVKSSPEGDPKYTDPYNSPDN